MLNLVYAQAVPAEDAAKEVLCADACFDGRVLRAAGAGRRFAAGGLTLPAIARAGFAVLIGIAVSITANRTCAAVLGTFGAILHIGVAQSIPALHNIAGGTAQCFNLRDAHAVPFGSTAKGVLRTDAFLDEFCIAARPILFIATVANTDAAIEGTAFTGFVDGAYVVTTSGRTLTTIV